MGGLEDRGSSTAHPVPAPGWPYMGRRRRARTRRNALLPRAHAAGGAASLRCTRRVTTRGVRRAARGRRGRGVRGGGDATTLLGAPGGSCLATDPRVCCCWQRPAAAGAARGRGHCVNDGVARSRAEDPTSDAASRSVRAACGRGRRPRGAVGPLALLAAGSPVGGTGVSRPPPSVRLAVGASVASDLRRTSLAWRRRAGASRAGRGPGRTRLLCAAPLLPRCASNRHESPAGGGPRGAATNIDHARGRLDTPASRGLWGCGAAPARAARHTPAPSHARP